MSKKPSKKEIKTVKEIKDKQLTTGKVVTKQK